MRRTQVMQQRGDGKTVNIFFVAIAIDGEVDHREEGVSVHALIFAHLSDRLVAKTQVDAKRTKTLEDIVVVAYDGDQLVVSLIHFLILHTYSLLYINNLKTRCKETKKIRNMQ